MLKYYLDKLYNTYAHTEFIDSDPIQMAYLFSSLADREITGFFSALFSWGRRDIIVKKTNELISRMDNSPYDFIMNATLNEISSLENFTHRTFQFEDLKFFLGAFKEHYLKSDTLETAFFQKEFYADTSIERHLNYFHKYFISLFPMSNRTHKHLAAPQKGSACKRLCMFLRWMVRHDNIDLGIWKNIKPHQLVIPLDVHVIRTAQQLGLLAPHSKANWTTALALTNTLKTFCPDDPIKYDLALFGLGIQNSKFNFNSSKIAID